MINFITGQRIPWPRFESLMTENKTERIQLRVTPYIKTYFKDLAQELGLSQSEIFDRMIDMIEMEKDNPDSTYNLVVTLNKLKKDA